MPGKRDRCGNIHARLKPCRAGDDTTCDGLAFTCGRRGHDGRRGLFAETEAHGVRVTRLALQLAERVAPELAADPRLEYGFRLHDIGMIGVSDSILAKRGTLSRDELEEMREHPFLGARIVASVS